MARQYFRRLYDLPAVIYKKLTLSLPLLLPPRADQSPYYWLDLEIPGLLSLSQYKNRKLKL